MALRPGLLALLAAALASAAPARAADPLVDRAVQALSRDPSVKVRTQAALVLAQRGAREALPALMHAVVADDEPAVRIAAAAALARIGDVAARDPLDAAARADPDEAVRGAARKSLADLLAASGRAVALEEPQGRAGDAAARGALREALARHLRRQGFAVVAAGDPAGWRLKPAVLAVEVSHGGGKISVAVKASVLAVDSQGRMAAMVEGGARLRASGGGEKQLAARALDAAAGTLSEDLAARLR